MMTPLKINILAILSTLFISFPQPSWSNVPHAKYINVIKVNSSFADFDANSWERHHPVYETETSNKETVICNGETILLSSNYVIGNQWYKNDAENTPSIPSALLLSERGRFTFKSTLNGCISMPSNEVIVSVYDNPLTPVISQFGNLLESSSISGNQWYLNGVLIKGAVDKQYSPAVSGNYTLKVTLNNCSSLLSNSFDYTFTNSTEKVRLKWINFSPYHLQGQNPNSLSVIPEDQIIYLLDSLKPYAEGIRTFGTQYGLELVPALAKQRGFKVIVGIWLSRDAEANAAQIANGIAIANAGYADRLIVGSEVMLRGDLSPTELIEFIKQVKQACPNIPVSTADVYFRFTEHPEVIQEVDFIAANIYPFWEGVAVECAMMRFHEAYLSLLPIKGGKEILISEAGWKTKGPNVGEATPSLKNAIRYDRELLSWSKAYGIPVCLFSFIDEPWKSNGVNDDDGWGIFDNTVKLKAGMDTLFTPIINIDTTWLCKKLNTTISSDALKIDYLPVMGSSDNIKGHVNFLPACGYSIAAYIKVGEVWWTKPFLSTPTVSIQCNGKWTVDYTTGGSDQLATDICLFLVSSSYDPPPCLGCPTIPPSIAQNALSSKCITRYVLSSASLTASKETICPGDTVLLTAQGGTNYIWSTGDDRSSIQVPPTTTTTYSVTITDANGGGAIIEQTISVNTAPAGAISINSLNICAGDTATLTASGGIKYIWSTGQTTSTIKVSPQVNTNYKVTVSNAAECSDMVSATIYPDIPPAAVYAFPDTICIGGSVRLQAGEGVSYLWGNGRTSDSIMVNPAITTIYSVKVTTENGCIYQSQDTVVVLPQPLVTAKAFPEKICRGDTVLLVANGGPLKNWLDLGLTSDSVKIAPNKTTTYQVSVTNTQGCSSTALVTVQVSNKPILSISVNPTKLCFGDTSTLKASGAVKYIWNDGVISETIKVSPKINTNYVVTGTNSDGCTDTASISVFPDIPPVSAQAFPVVICSGEAARLRAGKGVSYIWSDGRTSDSITVNPATTTIYSVKVTTENGCIYQSQDTVLVLPQPLVTAKAFPEKICLGDTVLLVANGGPLKNWLDLGLTSDSVKIAPAQTTTYQVSVTNNQGCTSIASVIVQVSNKPTLSISVIPINLCFGDTSTLKASGGVKYIWNNGVISETIKVSPKINTNYVVTGTNSEGCTDTASASVFPDTSPVAVQALPDLICSGEAARLRAGKGVSYIWSDGRTSDSITVNPPITTIYSVKVTTANGCIYQSQDTVVVLPKPVLIAKAIPDKICQGDAVLLVAEGGPPYNWFDLGLTSDSVKIVPNQTTTYQVSVTNNQGCTSIASVIVQVASKPTLSVSARPDSIHIGETSTLTAVSGMGNHYIWKTGDTSSTIQVSPKTTTTYSVTIKNSDGCIKTDSVKVTVLTPTVAASNSLIPKSIIVYPNPTVGIIRAELKLNDFKSVEILLLNELGTVIHKRKEKPVVGEMVLNFDLSSLSSGLYFLQVITENGKTWVEKVIKL